MTFWHALAHIGAHRPQATPNWIAFTPDSDRLFVSNSALDSVSVIDATVMKPVAVVPVGSVPKRINTLVLR